jgi:hypothetical protein
VSQTESGPAVGGNRIVPRYPFEVRIKIQVERGEDPLETDGWVRDLSESGLGAFVAAAILMGESVTLRVPLPNGIELVIPAKVTRSLGTQYGFQFTALSAEQRNEIVRALAGKKAIPYNPISG